MKPYTLMELYMSNLAKTVPCTLQRGESWSHEEPLGYLLFTLVTTDQANWNFNASWFFSSTELSNVYWRRVEVQYVL